MFDAYLSPLLSPSGRYQLADQPTEGRFDSSSPWGVKYRERYWKKALFDTVAELKTACDKHDITCADAAHRWLVHHSKMDATQGDKVIIGASSLAHAKANLHACTQGPLPQDVLDLFDKGWQQHMPDCPCYFR
jgi:aflatoxin B1 aldehyde reductase